MLSASRLDRGIFHLFCQEKNWHFQILEMYNICLSPQQGPSNRHINFSHKRTKNAFCSFAVVVLPQRISCFTHSLRSEGIASRTRTKHRGQKFETQLRLVKVAQCFSTPPPPTPPPPRHFTSNRTVATDTETSVNCKA